MMLPILISVSVAPTSYFFCASAPVLAATRIARAAEKAPNRNWIAGILISLVCLNVSIFLIGSAFRPLGRIEYLLGIPSNKKPRATGSQGASFSRTAYVTDMLNPRIGARFSSGRELGIGAYS